MTVAELKKALENVPDGATVEVPVRTFTQAYPQAYVNPFDAQYMGDIGLDRNEPGTFRLTISLGEGISIMKRKSDK